MPDRYDYRARAEQMAGTGNEKAVHSVASFLHSQESLHLHENVEKREPCSYCWLRAGKSVYALVAAGLNVVMPEPEKATAGTEPTHA